MIIRSFRRESIIEQKFSGRGLIRIFSRGLSELVRNDWSEYFREVYQNLFGIIMIRTFSEWLLSELLRNDHYQNFFGMIIIRTFSEWLLSELFRSDYYQIFFGRVGRKLVRRTFFRREFLNIFGEAVEKGLCRKAIIGASCRGPSGQPTCSGEVKERPEIESSR